MASDGSTVVAVLGETLIDLVEKGDDEPRLAHPGGSPYNVAIGLARLGRPTAFVGRFSRDPFGQLLRRHAERSDVDLSLAVAAAEPATIAVVTLEQGIAEYAFSVDGTADFLFTDGELAPVAARASALHFGSLASWLPPGDAAVERLVRRLRDTVPVTYDPNVRPHLQPDRDAAREHVERSLALAHLVKTSEEDLDYLYPGRDVAAIAQEWLATGPDLVVVTRGGNGAEAHLARGVVARPVLPIDMVDTVGAGDAFMTGLLDGLLARDLLTVDGLGCLGTDVAGDLLDDAALVAAITCSRAGANPPRLAELEAARCGAS